MREKCIYCGFKNLRTFANIGNYFVKLCRRCQLVQTSQCGLHSIKEVNKKIYDDEYLGNYLRREEELKSRFGKRVEEIEETKDGGKILDVGCSVGFFLESMQKVAKYRWELYGIDLNEKSIDIAKKRLKANLSLGTIKTAKYPTNFFDCVTCFDVLEHDGKLPGTLREIYRILKPDGLLLTQSPNHKSIMAVLSGNNWDWWSIPDHVIHFSPSTYSKIISRSSFLIHRMFTWEPTRDFIENIQGNIRKELPKAYKINRIIARILKYPLHMLWLVTSIVERVAPVGGLIVIYAKKNK